ncbi:MAG: WD40 repeat domain-containing protein [Bacteroidia bacterium]|nr:WD40 repeat domain-containing protein [Bacteroidia bacterium]
MIKCLFSILSLLLCFSSISQTIINSTVVQPGHSNDVNAAIFSPLKTKRMATAGWDNKINIYQADSPFNLLQSLNGHNASVNCLAYNITGGILASGGNDFNVMFWDSFYRRKSVPEDLNNRHQANINSLVFDRANKYLFSGDNNGKIIIWDAINPKALKSLNTSAPINDISLSPNPANIFIASSEPKIKLIALATNKIVKTLDGHTDAVNSIAISPNNLYLISGSNDKTARIWDLRSMKQLYLLKVECWKVTAVAFTDDSKYCVTACNDGSIKVWETETGKLINNTEPQNFNIRDINFSKNGQMLIVAPLMRGSKEYGARLMKSNIPVLVPQVFLKPLTAPQKALDSLMKIRTLTKQDSLKYKNLLTTKSKDQLLLLVQSKSLKIDSAIIYKTPMLQKKNDKIKSH